MTSSLARPTKKSTTMCSGAWITVMCGLMVLSIFPEFCTLLAPSNDTISKISWFGSYFVSIGLICRTIHVASFFLASARSSVVSKITKITGKESTLLSIIWISVMREHIASVDQSDASQGPTLPRNFSVFSAMVVFVACRQFWGVSSKVGNTAQNERHVGNMLATYLFVMC